MSEFDERKLQHLPTCWSCKHYYVDSGDGEHGYCLLGLSKEEKDHVDDQFSAIAWDKTTYELLELPEDGSWYESPRGITPDGSCQFWERPKYEPEEEQDEQGTV